MSQQQIQTPDAPGSTAPRDTRHDPQESPAPGAIPLDEEARELVGLELRALLPALQGERRERYEALAEAAAAGSVPADLVPALEGLVVLALQTARARSLYRAEGERVLTGVFRRTPRGRELAAHLEDVNKALRALKGRPVTGVRVGMRTLGHFTVAVATEGATVTLAVRADGVRVESVAAGNPEGPAG